MEERLGACRISIKEMLDTNEKIGLTAIIGCFPCRLQKAILGQIADKIVSNLWLEVSWGTGILLERCPQFPVRTIGLMVFFHLD